MNAQEVLAYINYHKWNRTDPGLDRSVELLSRLGDPQKKLRFIHVGGTNGKGSTCAMLAAIFMEAGYRVGMYPSPYLEEFRERIQINGVYIPQSDLERIAGLVAEAADAMDDHPTQFELITAIGMVYFAEQRCDLVVLEVGMGGELDSTNVIDPPEAAVLTHIGLDHTDYLGTTIPEITRTKCGIIKEGSCLVSYANDPEAMAVIEETCSKKQVPLYYASGCDLQPLDISLDGQRFIWHGRVIRGSLLGAHQLENTRTAITTVEALIGRGWKVTEDQIASGLQKVVWPGRFEVLRRKPAFILDAGHNPQCAEAVAAGIRDYLPGRKVTILIGILKDKDVPAVLAALYPYAEKFVCVTPDSPRALEAADLAALIRKDGRQAMAEASIESAVRLCLDDSSDVVAFGSFYMAGEVRRLVREITGQAASQH